MKLNQSKSTNVDFILYIFHFLFLICLDFVDFMQAYEENFLYSDKITFLCFSDITDSTCQFHLEVI